MDPTILFLLPFDSDDWLSCHPKTSSRVNNHIHVSTISGENWVELLLGGNLLGNDLAKYLVLLFRVDFQTLATVRRVKWTYY